MLNRLPLFCLLLSTCFASLLYAQPAELAREDLEPFLDGVMAAHLSDYHIPGAVIAVVKDSELLLAKGYGYANLEEKTPVDPEKTLFRPASITKTFVWTAVMQLVEAKKLDLDEDVNTYLKYVEIPPTFAEPITMRHLMTHTPGFEDKVIGLFRRNSASMEKPLSDVLNDDMPVRIYPPGKITAYSNYGVALAGHVVEQITGMPLTKYLKEKVLQPLDMQRTTLWQPLPNTLRADMATGYSYSLGIYRPHSFEFVPLAPAGGLSTTAGDMAKFMLSHLQGASGLLKPETAKLLHSREFDNGLAQNRIHGFVETNFNGVRTFGHGGATSYFHSEMVLAPAQNLGLFVSYNSSTAPPAKRTLLKAFFDRYFPYQPAETLQPTEDFKSRAGKLAGVYQHSRRNHTTFEKLISMVGYGLAAVSVTDNNTLMLYGAGIPSEWIELEPLLFRRMDGADTMQFEADTAGNITGMSLENVPVFAFKKLNWRENPNTHFAFLIFALALSIIIVVMIFRTLHGEASVALLTRRLAAIDGLLCLLFFGGILGTMGAMMDGIIFGMPWFFGAFFILPWLLVLLTVPVVLMTLVFAWPGGYWDWQTRLLYTMFALTMLGMIWFMQEWNLLNYFF